MDAARIKDIFEPAGAVRCRRMFGGHGIYLDAVMIAIEADGEIFLKVDEHTIGAFEAAGSRAFTYVKAGKPHVMSYWRLPEVALDDAQEFRQWAITALDAARRASAGRLRQPAVGRQRRY